MNRSKKLINFAAAALLLFALAAAASAQVTSVGGKVLLKKADGTTAPLAGATVKFYRTDIKGEYEAKSDKSGRYVYAGLPLVGTFTVVVSGPGAKPTYRIGFRAINSPENNAVLEPGDGSILTLADVATLEAMKGTAPTGTGVNMEEAKKKAGEIAAERKRVEAENARATEINAKAPDILKAGNEAFAQALKLTDNAAKMAKYDEAIARYEEGIALLSEDPVFHRNKSVTLFSRGRDRYNVAVKVRPNDQAGITAAREDMKVATDEAEKAVSAQQAKSSSGASGAGGATQPNQTLDLLSARAEAYRLALTTSTAIDNDAAAKAIEAYINAEPDQTKKDAAQAGLGDALRFAGKYDEAIAKFREVLTKNPSNLDAIFGLGIALASKSGTGDTDPKLVSEARDALKDFVAKAPDTNPRKQEAAGMVAYLDDTVKGMAASKEAEPKSTKTTRRKP